MTPKDQVRTGRAVDVPPRSEWPEVGKRSEGGVVLTDVVLATFRLNARLMEAAQGMAANGGITAAWWQVLGGVLDEPRSVADVGRIMGVSRQGVQRIADLLVERGLAEFRPNPAHRRAKLLACTEAGYWAIRQISLAQGPWTTDLAKAVDLEDLRTTLSTLQTLITKLEEA
ncbi:MarR family winged helix-turn-helix transcriptional regulator [Kribbella sp. NPDC055110]